MTNGGVSRQEFSCLGEEGEGGPGAMETLLEEITHMRVRCINSQGNGCSRFRVSKNRNESKEELGVLKGGVKFRDRKGEIYQDP